MKVIIVEDEPSAAKKLAQLLVQLDTSVQVVAVLSSVRDTVNWLRKNSTPDLGFFDIQLSDDTSFQIFTQEQVNFPVIFTTAYDDYMLQAFEVNAVHYLLKPISENKLEQALEKVKGLEKHFANKGLFALLESKQQSNRMIVQKGSGYVPLEVSEIAYAFSEHKISFIRDRNGETYITDQPLSELETVLRKRDFFRINRQYLVSINSVKRFKSVEGSKIELELNPGGDKVIIGKDKAADFKKWIKGI